MLTAIDTSLPDSSPLREGLKKAGLAICDAFVHGRRGWIEDTYNGLEDPLADLTPEQRAHLLSLGIDPDD
jgi:hypothetical protein